MPATLDFEEFKALTITFDQQGNSREYVAEGWSWAENVHTWMTGSRSMLRLPPVTTGRKLVTIEAAPFIHRVRPVQRIQFIVNGIAVGWHEFSEHGTKIASHIVEDGAFSASEANELTLYHPDFAVPMELGASGDWRELSLAIFRLVIEDAPVQKALTGPSEPDLALMARFESIGDNCEFGLFQRRMGAEPLGLFRFAGVDFDGLVRLLRSDFVGVGDPSTIRVVGGVGKEFIVYDDVYKFSYHTFIPVDRDTPEDILAKQTPRLKFLARKLCEDLENGEKVFVYKQEKPPLEGQIDNLISAIRHYGQATLLWVGLADDEHPAGTVMREKDGLLRGYMSRFSPLANAAMIDVDTWLTICRQAQSGSQQGCSTLTKFPRMPRCDRG